jgi:stage II sporulation protein D
MICRIVRNEVGAHYTYGAKNGQTVYDADTIKAFAVAAYSMLKYCERKGEVASVGLNKNVSQALRDYVAEVDGEAIYYNGSYICALYCASTGGTTLSSKNSWGVNNPYLVSVESKYDSQGKQYVTTQTFSKQEMESMIEAKTGIALSDNPENWLVISSTIDGTYVDQLIIDGNSTCSVRGKNYRITGTYFRNSIIGASKLMSPDFTVEYIDGYFYFTVYGYGHGVGMSADGAQLYATLDGWDYRQILTHYYTGVEIA